MRWELFEAAVALVVAGVDLFGTVLLTGLGLRAESLALAGLGGGELVMGLWFAYIGAVAIFAGVELLGRRRLLPRLARTVSR